MYEKIMDDAHSIALAICQFSMSQIIVVVVNSKQNDIQQFSLNRSLMDSNS